MKKGSREKITLVCPDRLEMNKFCKFCRKHTLHKESK